MIKTSWKTTSLLCTLSMMFLLSWSFVSSVSGDGVQADEVDVNVYVLSLVNVDGHGVENISRVVEGVLSACQVDTLHYWTEELKWTYLYPHHVYKEIKIDVNVTVLNDWDSYKSVVESGCGVIIVNCHGETIPVPSGHTKESWVDEVADAMAYRNVTWVHTAGYPFYYYHLQEDEEDVWGEEGFQRLMGHMGKENVTCHPPGYETKIVDMHLVAREALMIHGWSALAKAMRVQRGRPLNASDFNDYIVLPIWGHPDDFVTGAVIRFTKVNETRSFGFYVHVGTNQTYTSDGIPTEASYWRGYAGTAAAIYTVSFRFTSEGAISDAEAAVAKAETEGRTKGLDQARKLLNDARYWHDSYCYDGALLRANKAEEAAEKAVKPSFTEIYAFPIAIISVGCLSTATVLIVRRRRNTKERETK